MLGHRHNHMDLLNLLKYKLWDEIAIIDPCDKAAKQPSGQGVGMLFHGHNHMNTVAIFMSE